MFVCHFLYTLLPAGAVNLGECLFETQKENLKSFRV